VPRRLRRSAGLALAAALLLACWLLNVSRPGTPAAGCLEHCSQPGETPDGPLQVMSLNMLHGFPRFERLRERLDLLAGEIRMREPDIVCLQEVPWAPHIGNAAQYLAERTGLNYVYLRANGNRWAILFEEGEAILSRYPLEDVTFTELQPRAGLFEHRVVLGATIDAPGGRLRIFVTHLTNGEPEVNRGQAQSLMAFVRSNSEGPAIIAGDFNAREGSLQIHAISQQAVDTFRATNPQLPGNTCCFDDLSSASSEGLEERIDYVFLLAPPEYDARALACERILDQALWAPTGWLRISDHAGLLATVFTTGSRK
jgi:endonuclease/exonuclease/phosphatase family metal-dependent hydrolase